MLHTLDGKGPWRHSILSGVEPPHRPGVFARLAAALRRLFGAPTTPV